jgi:hypothetical protein
MARQHEVYLGDGLFAHSEPERELIWLRAPRIPVDHAVRLEPPVVDRFLAYLCERGYAEALDRALNNHRGGGR